MPTNSQACDLVGILLIFFSLIYIIFRNAFEVTTTGDTWSSTNCRMIGSLEIKAFPPPGFPGMDDG